MYLRLALPWLLSCWLLQANPCGYGTACKSQQEAMKHRKRDGRQLGMAVSAFVLPARGVESLPQGNGQ